MYNQYKMTSKSEDKTIVVCGVPGKQSLSLSGNFSKNDMRLGVSYVNQLGDKLDNTSFDRDYVSANISYSF